MIQFPVIFHIHFLHVIVFVLQRCAMGLETKVALVIVAVTKFLVKITFLYKLVESKKLDFVLSKLQISI